MLDGSVAEAPVFLLVARRNDSLRPAGRRLVFGLVGLVSLSIAFGFALVGAWMILPFAGAELLGLYAAFRCIERHARDYERVAVEGDKVVVESCVVGRVQRSEFSRYWARVVVRDTGGECRIAVRSHGHEAEFGRMLSASQRRAVASQLDRQLRVTR